MLLRFVEALVSKSRGVFVRQQKALQLVVCCSLAGWSAGQLSQSTRYGDFCTVLINLLNLCKET
jgi:hypothetical protein